MSTAMQRGVWVMSGGGGQMALATAEDAPIE